jgi:acyl-CoA synthetase (AMP-forming)/AMP-acid ligase II
MPDSAFSGSAISVFTAQAARRFAAHTALIHGAQRWTFAEFDAVVDRLASGLSNRLGPGERACVFLTNRPECVFLQAALERAGIVRIPVNARLTAREVAAIMADSEAAALFYDTTTADRLGPLNEARRSQSLWLCAVDSDQAVNGPTYANLLKDPVALDRLHKANAEDLCSINYTSGSSGRPKGVMLTHRNWMAVYRNMLIDRDIRGDDIVAHIGPLSHASGTYFMPWFLRGATNVIVEGGSIENLLQAIQDLGVTVFTCVPTVLTRIVNHPAVDDYDLRTLRAIGYGAEPIPRNTLEKALARFGPILTQNYGLTEAMMTCITLSPEDHFAPDGSIRIGALGRAYSFVEVLLRNPDGSPVAPGEIGEITIRSEHVMAGYWRMPEETAKVLRNGWLWSGDLARMDEGGLITLAGRSKEMLISGGFNIYPQELEAVLTSCPRILEAAVIGVPDPNWGEAAVAFVSTVPGVSSEVAPIIDFCKPILGFKTPKQFIVLPSLPKNGNGKVDKISLRDRLSVEMRHDQR